MSTEKAARKPIKSPFLRNIRAFSICGYKSIATEQRIELRPLTILAGANSAGKSSMIQPLLLLKQTLTASFDPGSLKLDGPNVRLSSVEQLLSSIGSPVEKGFTVDFELDNDDRIKLIFAKENGKGMRCIEMTYLNALSSQVTVHPGMSMDDIERAFPSFKEQFKILSGPGDVQWRVIPYRGFLDVAGMQGDSVKFWIPALPVRDVALGLEQLIHLPGFRGKPNRDYPITSVGQTFPGTFEEYTASLIHAWGDTEPDKLKALNEDLQSLGLTWKVEAEAKNDTRVEIRVGRLPRPKRGRAKDMVSIADVGFGVSQTLPVLVALRAAEPGQLVYLEQPEIHLHPRAQRALSRIIADAAQRGVIVIVETHSSLLLRGFQTLAATPGQLDPSLVKLHWFSRDETYGATVVTAADLDDRGAFGDWPVDFDEVELKAEQDYLDAVEAASAAEAAEARS